MKNFVGKVMAFCIAIILAIPCSSWAKIYLDINAPAMRLLPIAIPVPIPLEGTAPNPRISGDIRDVLAGDLDFSSVFRVLDPVLYLEDAENSGIRPNTFGFDDWELIDAEALIKTGYAVKENGEVELEFHLYDVFQKKELTAKRWKGKPGQIRRMVHMFTNAVMKEITGEDGIFLTSVLYAQSGGRGRDIHRMDFNGANAEIVVHNGFLNLSPTWWPDRRGMIYTYYKKGAPDLCSMAFGGKEKRVTVGAGVDVGASFSPDGRSIALMSATDGNPDIYRSDRNGGHRLRLTRLRSVEATPTWSPDGKRIAFVSDRYGSPQIFVMNADGSDPMRITYEGNYNSSPAWSPDGKLIAYTSRINGGFGILLIDPDTLESRPLVGEAGNNEDPSWSPDGRFIVFSSNRTGTYQLYVVDREGRKEIRTTSGRGDKTSPAWSPR